VSKGDTKKKAGDEAAEIMGIWDSDYTEPADAPTKVLQWDSGDLSLIKGVDVQGESVRGATNQEHRRVLKHMRFVKDQRPLRTY
jgi:hypothetical protein